MSPKRRHSESQLEPFGWTGREAEWIALVCQHSGLFTRSQFCTYLHARPNRARQFVHGLRDRRQAVDVHLDGFPASARLCRISGKAIYQALGIENVSHRRTASAPVLMRRLLSLDYILEHPQQPWLTSEQDKVAVFDDFDIPRQALPRRYYTGNKAVWVRYFALELPISIGPETITFVYVDPGYDTDRNLMTWGSSHVPLWQALRRKGRRIRVVAVARDDLRSGRANKVLSRWTQGHWPKGQKPLTPDEEQEIEEIRLAFFRRDWPALDRWGGPQAALFHQRGLKRRPAFHDAESGFRIDRADTWRSLRLSFPRATLS